MEPTLTILLSIFFVFAISMFMLLFGNPRNAFFSTEFTSTVTNISPTSAQKEENELYHRMPDPPAHITQGFQRAPSLNTPYPKKPPPLGFEQVAMLPEVSVSNVSGSLPYPIGDIPQMPQPFDARLPPHYIPENEWSYIEEQIVKEVASDSKLYQHLPSNEEEISDNEVKPIRQRH